LQKMHEGVWQSERSYIPLQYLVQSVID